VSFELNTYYLVSSSLTAITSQYRIKTTLFFAAALVKFQKLHTGNLANLVIQNMCIVYSRSTVVCQTSVTEHNARLY